MKVSCPAITRSQVRTGLQPLPDLDSSLLQGRTKGPKKSHRQRRLEKYPGTPASEASVEGLNVSGWQVPGNFAESLKPLFKKAASANPSHLCNERYELFNNVLHLQANDVTRLVVPTCCRPLVLHLTHMGWSSRPTKGIYTHQLTFSLANNICGCTDTLQHMRRMSENQCSKLHVAAHGAAEPTVGHHCHQNKPIPPTDKPGGKVQPNSQEYAEYAAEVCCRHGTRFEKWLPFVLFVYR